MADPANDFVADVLRVVVDESAHPGPDLLRRIEQRVRLAWGGERPYIGKAPGRLNSWKALDALSVGSSVSDAIRGAGMSRSGFFGALRRNGSR